MKLGSYKTWLTYWFRPLNLLYPGPYAEGQQSSTEMPAVGSLIKTLPSAKSIPH